MKPFSVLLSIVLGLISLSFIVWIGRPTKIVPETKPVTTVEDLPMPKSGPYGKAEIEETDFNFGTKLVGSHDQHTFTIKNVGEGILNLKLGKPTCQCTGVEISKEGGEAFKDGEGSIAPGEVAHVEIKWKMMAVLEKFRHGAPLFTTDPNRRKIDLNVMGAVDSAFKVQTSSWDLGELLTTEPSKAEGIVSSNVYDQFKLVEEPRENSKVKVNSEPVTPAELEQSGAKSALRVKVEVSPDVPAGLFRESIKMKAVAGEVEQNIEFTVTGRRAGPIDVRGVTGGAGFNMGSNRLVFQNFPADAGKTVKLTMFVKGMDEDLVLKGVEPSDSRFKIKLESGKVLGKSKSYQLEVQIPPGPPGLHRAEEAEVVNLKLNHPEAPDFKLLLDYNAVR